MDYAKERLEKELSKFPIRIELEKASRDHLLKIISELNKTIFNFKENINNHQQKAMYHIENTEKTKNAKKRRGKENKSMSNIFLSEPKNVSTGFVTANNLKMKKHKEK